MGTAKEISSPLTSNIITEMVRKGRAPVMQRILVGDQQSSEMMISLPPNGATIGDSIEHSGGVLRFRKPDGTIIGYGQTVCVPFDEGKKLRRVAEKTLRKTGFGKSTAFSYNAMRFRRWLSEVF